MPLRRMRFPGPRPRHEDDDGLFSKLAKQTRGFHGFGFAAGLSAHGKLEVVFSTAVRCPLWPRSFRHGRAAPFMARSRFRDVPEVTRCRVLASDDERVNAQWPEYEAALKAAKVRYTLFQPADTKHGFNNDTTPRYDEDAAAQAWSRMLALFTRTLKS